VSFGALGVPIIALAAVTNYPLLALAESSGTIVAVPGARVAYAIMRGY